MGLTEIRAAIIDILGGADANSVIQDFENWSTEDEPESLVHLFKPLGSPKDRAWVFKPVSIREETVTRECNQIIYVFAFRMVDEIKERQVTGDTWTVINAVRTAFRSNHELNQTAFSTRVGMKGGGTQAGLQVDRVEFFAVENRPVQYGEFSLFVREITAI